MNDPLVGKESNYLKGYRGQWEFLDEEERRKIDRVGGVYLGRSSYAAGYKTKDDDMAV